MKNQKILLPFDGSVSSINATRYALDFAKLMEAHVTIINCYDWNATIVEAPSPLIKDIDVICKRKAEDTLKIAHEIFKDRGVKYTTEALLGSPGKVLADLAKAQQYDLIIMGSHGHSEIAGLFLGSVTHKVLNTIYCPVMVVP